jgi:hypothetical protein
MLALVWKGSGASLTRVDAMTLRAVGGAALRIHATSLVGRSPRGVTLAFGTGGGALAFVDAGSLRLRGSMQLCGTWIAAAAWPSAGRLVAVTGSDATSCVVVVDPGSRREVVERPLPFSDTVLSAEPAAGRVVFLIADRKSVSGVRLGVAGADGTLRTVALDRIQGGTELPDDAATGAVTQARPALAVDPGSRRAAVVDAAGQVAEVDLSTLAVLYHPRALRAPARAGKALDGWDRTALWLPSGNLAVTGIDYHSSVQNGTERMTGTAAGVTLYDTSTWAATAIAPGASAVVRVGNTLLAYGGGYAFQGSSSSQSGIGLRGFAADGTPRFQLFASERIGDVQVAGGLVYVGGCHDRCFKIVDPASGTVVGSPRTALTTRLVGL